MGSTVEFLTGERVGSIVGSPKKRFGNTYKELYRMARNLLSNENISFKVFVVLKFSQEHTSFWRYYLKLSSSFKVVDNSQALIKLLLLKT